MESNEEAVIAKVPEERVARIITRILFAGWRGGLKQRAAKVGEPKWFPSETEGVGNGPLSLHARAFSASVQALLILSSGQNGSYSGLPTVTRTGRKESYVLLLG